MKVIFLSSLINIPRCLGLSLEFILLGLLSIQGVAQEKMEKEEILLNNPAIIIQATEAVNLMYDFNFKEANKRFKWIKNDYPDHPMGYFLLGLSEWWRIVPDVEETRYDKSFLAYMDTAINKAEAMGGKKSENAEKVFFLAGAYAFKARLNSERENYTKASFTGKKALQYLQKSREYLDWSPEFLFGEGLYNYYREWIPDNYKYLKPIMLFFPKGDKQEGIKQLEKNAQVSFYTRTEAQYWLMRIYDEENDQKNSFRMAKYLNETFPNNPYFHRYYARLLFTGGQLVETEVQSRTILDRINDNRAGYEANSGRYASFFLGYIYQFRDKDLNLARLHYEEAIQYSESNGAFDTGYNLWSHAYLARMDDELGNKDSAIKHYELIKEYADKKSELGKESRKYLKENKKGKGFLFFG